MRGNWDKVNGAIRGALSRVTLADMTPNFIAFPARPEVAPVRSAAPAK